MLADELLLLSFAQRSGAPDDYALLAGYELPRTAGFGIKKNEPHFKDVVDRTLLILDIFAQHARSKEGKFVPSRRSLP